MQVQQKGLCFVCSHAVDEIWVRSTLLELHRRNFRVNLYILVSKLDQIKEIKHIYADTFISVIGILNFKEIIYDGSFIAITSSSGIKKDYFSTPPSHLIHMPHSLASLHAIYPIDCFDDYDILFASGPHHSQEFSAITKARGLKNKRIYEVGYGKLDILKEDWGLYQSTKKNSSKKSTILMAPSWGEENLLESCELGFIEKLIEYGLRVILRPHPMYFIEKHFLLKRYEAKFQDSDRFILEDSLISNVGLLEADIFLGDYSGTSFEFFALQKRPVISVDVSKKISNANWRDYGLTPIEIGFRDKIGLVLPLDSNLIFDAIIKITNHEYDLPDLEISSYIYNSEMQSGVIASDIILGLLND